ncbi:MAG: hypothetical protein WBG86_02450 [Polyangiales bacterium]
MLRALYVRRIGAALLLLVALLPTADTAASTVEGLSLEELIARAHTIVVGEIVWQETVVGADGMIRTWSRVRVDERLRGDAVGGDEVLVETLGGQVGRLVMQVPGEPRFSIGEKVVVFAREIGVGGLHPVGMAQGVVRVSLEDGVETAMPSLEGLLLVRRGAGGGLTKSTGPLAENEPLAMFLTRVRDIAESQGRAP